MTNFEKLLPFLVAALVVGCAVVLWFALRVEQRLAARKKVTLENYREKNHLFYITRDFPVAVTAGALALCSLVLGVIALCNPVIRPYAVALLLLTAVDAGAVYFTLTRTKFARDLRVFDAYYVKVADMLAGKARTEMDLEICTRRVSELRARLIGTIADFNRNLTEQISDEFCPELFAPLDAMIAEYKVETLRFAAEIEADFNRALAEFLQTEQEPALRVVPVRSFDEGTVDDLLAEVKTAYASRVTELVIGQVSRGAVADAKALGNIMKLFHTLGVKVDAETLARFLRAAAVFEDRTELATLLYGNKQITAQTVCELLIPEDMEWAFAPGMAGAFNARELTAIISALLAADRAAMCYLLLSQMTAEQKQILEEALASFAGKEQNAAVRQAKAFRLILGTEYAVGNMASVFENLALMLDANREDLGLTADEQASITEIVREGCFMAKRREIGALYTKATKRGAALCESATRVLLQYIMDPTEQSELFDERRLVALFGEYRFTLSFADLSVLRALVGGCLLCTTEDEGVRAAVAEELTSMPYLLTPDTNEEMRAFGARLLAALAEQEIARLRAVIYRTESERLTLDRVLALSGKGA